MSTFIYMGIPTKRRARVTRNGHVYADPKTEAEEQGIRAQYRGRLHEGKVAVHVHVYPKLPEGTPKYVERLPHLKKPDVDNVLKVVLDALNGAAYGDDVQVVEARVQRHDASRIRDSYITVTVMDAD